MRRTRRPWWTERGVYGTLRDGVVTMWLVGYTGVPCKCVQFPAEGKRGRDLSDLCERYAEMLLDKHTPRNVVGGVAGQVDDEEFSVLYPNLYAYMTQSKWPDGTARQTSSLSIFVDGKVAKCVLKDRELGICLWASCPTFTGLYGVIDSMLGDPGAEWREDRQSPGDKARKVKR